MDTELKEEHKKFCELYVYSPMRGNAVQCYLEVYDTNNGENLTYASAKAAASRLLTDVNLLAYIQTLLDGSNLNDQVVDNELAFLISQHADFGAKLGAIKEYNNIKQRIKQKVEHSGQVGFISEYVRQPGNEPLPNE